MYKPHNNISGLIFLHQSETQPWLYQVLRPYVHTFAPAESRVPSRQPVATDGSVTKMVIGGSMNGIPTEIWENHTKTKGKWWFCSTKWPFILSCPIIHWTLWFYVVTYLFWQAMFDFHWVTKKKVVSSGFMKHGWLENPRTEWRFYERNITEFYGPFSSQPCLKTPQGTWFFNILHDFFP